MTKLLTSLIVSVAIVVTYASAANYYITQWENTQIEANAEEAR